MTRLVNDIVTRLFLNGAWRDISDDVLAEDGLSISRGRGPEDDTTPPCEAKFLLNNTSGDYSERNPLGPWYGYLGQNTPIEQSLRIAKDTCSATVSSGWNTTETDGNTESAWTAYTWTTSGGSASDYNKASGKATHLISTAGQNRITYLGSISQRDIDVTLSLSLSFTDILVGNLATDWLLHGQSTTSFYVVRMRLVAADESVQLEIQNASGTAISTTVTVSGITHSSSQALHFRAQIEGRTLRAKVWHGTDRETTEPYTWPINFTDEPLTGYTTSAVMDMPGFVSIRSTVGSGNTNVPVTFNYDNIDIKLPLFSGEVSEWPQKRDETGNYRVVEINAGGIRRRLGQGDSPLDSPLKRALTYGLNNFGSVPLPFAYWPMENGKRAVTDMLAPTVGRGSLYFVPPESSTTVGKLEWAADSNTLPGSGPAPQIQGGASLFATLDTPTGTTAWAISWCCKQNYADGVWMLFSTESDHLLVNPNRAASALVFNVAVSIDGGASTNAVVHTFASKEDAEEWHQYLLMFTQDGSDIGINFYVDGDPATTTSAGTLTSTTIEGLRSMEFSTQDNTTGSTGYNHVAVFDDLNSLDPDSPWNAAQGNVGEAPIKRAHRISREDVIEFDWIGRASLADATQRDGQTMGSQAVEPRLSLYDACERVDGGLLYEQRSIAGFQFRTLNSMCARTSWCTLDVGDDKHVSPPWSGTNDDRFRRNQVTARRQDGGEFTYALDDGSKMSISDPSAGGIGKYDTSVTVNVEHEGQLPQQAGWRVALGTIDEERYPEIRVELHRDAIRNDTTLLARLRDLDVGEQITLATLTSNNIYEDSDQLVVGYDLFIDRFRHQLVLRCVPASILRTLVLDGTGETSRLDSDSTTLDEDLDTTETGVTVLIATGQAFWTTTGADYPFDLMIGGERMTASACTAASGQNQTFTVTRAVNGVTKTHSTGARVSLADPNYWGPS